MNMKKWMALCLAMLMVVLCFAGCGGKKEQTDLEYVKEKGTLLVGITDFEPMDYKDDSGKWIGFDADMATAFAKELGVEVQFVEIEWDNKVMELDGKTIDCVWNGMTLNDEVMAAMATSQAYCNNQQIVIVPKDKAEQCATVEGCKGMKFAVESGSAGKKEAVAKGFDVIEVKDQATALMEVAAGTADGAVIDSLMAAAMVGEGTSYANLTYTVGLSDEKYGVGFRKGSDLVAELNKFFDKALADGSMMKAAETYKVQAALITK